jgi:hypothetical protein
VPERLTVVPMTLREANDFVQSFHRHNGRTARDGGKFAIGAQAGGELVAVAIVGRPIARLADDGLTAEVTRVCCRPDAPKNANSFLYGACWRAWRAMGGAKLITYTLATESGASLRGAGWRVVGEVQPQEWNRKKRPRRWQPIYGQLKLRWEVTA